MSGRMIGVARDLGRDAAPTLLLHGDEHRARIRAIVRAGCTDDGRVVRRTFADGSAVRLVRSPHTSIQPSRYFTARPAISTRWPLSSQKSSDPRFEICREGTVFLLSRSAQ